MKYVCVLEETTDDDQKICDDKMVRGGNVMNLSSFVKIFVNSVKINTRFVDAWKAIVRTIIMRSV